MILRNLLNVCTACLSTQLSKSQKEEDLVATCEHSRLFSIIFVDKFDDRSSMASSNLCAKHLAALQFSDFFCLIMNSFYISLDRQIFEFLVRFFSLIKSIFPTPPDFECFPLSKYIYIRYLAVLCFHDIRWVSYAKRQELVENWVFLRLAPTFLFHFIFLCSYFLFLSIHDIFGVLIVFVHFFFVHRYFSDNFFFLSDSNYFKFKEVFCFFFCDFHKSITCMLTIYWCLLPNGKDPIR